MTRRTAALGCNVNSIYLPLEGPYMPLTTSPRRLLLGASDGSLSTADGFAQRAETVGRAFGLIQQ